MFEVSYFCMLQLFFLNKNMKNILSRDFDPLNYENILNF